MLFYYNDKGTAAAKRQTKAAVRPDLRVAAGAYPPRLSAATLELVPETHDDGPRGQEANDMDRHVARLPARRSRM